MKQTVSPAEAEKTRQMVKEKYTEIVSQDKSSNASSCCGSTCCSTEVYNIMSGDYSSLEGYVADADLGLGCGLPTLFAAIRPGETVLDLGSGAGNDCFVARRETGEAGKVIGVDMTEAMIERARTNAEKLNYNNVEFRLGTIENMPVGGNSIDVIISNCVLNLVPEKAQAFSEMYRVLKPGGRFAVSDIVLEGTLPAAVLQAAEMYAGCIAGAMQKKDYLAAISHAGFEDMEVKSEKLIDVPDDILSKYISAEDLEQFRKKPAGIFSITVTGRKKEACCDKDTCCK